jgi:alpha-galactosidase
VFEGCTLISRETNIKVCGICHGHNGYVGIVVTLGLDLDEVTYEAHGLNHCIWLTRFIYKGKNAYPLIDEWIETQAEEYWRTYSPYDAFDIQMSRAAVNQYRLYGLFPIGDTVRWGGWWYHTNIETKKRWYGEPWGGPDTEESRPFQVAMLSKKIEEIKSAVKDRDKKITESFFPEKTLEQHMPIIDAIVNDHEGQFQVNVPNRGSIEGLPDDVVVDIPAIVNKKGIKPIHVEKLPKKLMLEQILPRWLAMENILETYKSGDRSMLLWNVLQHHQTKSYEDAEALLEDLLALSNSAEAAVHYKWPKVWTIKPKGKTNP